MYIALSKHFSNLKLFCYSIKVLSYFAPAKTVWGRCCMLYELQLVWANEVARLPLRLIPEAVLMLRWAAAVIRADGQILASLSVFMGLLSLRTVSSSVSLFSGLIICRLSYSNAFYSISPFKYRSCSYLSSFLLTLRDWFAGVTI